MSEHDDPTLDDLVALAPSLVAMGRKIEAGEWTGPEADVFVAILQSVWPVAVDIFNAVWSRLEPILVEQGVWPPVTT